MTATKTARQKGKNAELAVAKLLSHWWCPETKGMPAVKLPFRRMAGSGADKGRPSDITVPEGFPFSVEVKNQEAGGWTFNGLLRNDWIVWDWWAQCTKDADGLGRHPLLCFTRAHQPWYCMMRKRSLQCIGSSYESVILAGTAFLLLSDLLALDPQKVEAAL